MTEQNADSDIFSLIYSSAAADGCTSDDFRKIAEKASAYNRDAGLTGMLLACEGLVMQFLEGPRTQVETLYEKIKRDPRHQHLSVLSTRTLPEREFPNWNMGFCEVVSADDPDYIFKLTLQTLNIKTPNDISDLSAALIKSFARSSALERRSGLG